jgi:RNA polymerase sigma-B factor
MAVRAAQAARPGPHPTASFDRAKLHKLCAEYAKTKAPQLRDELVTMHLNVVRYLASRFAHRGEPLDDLVQVGCVGLIKAVDRFDPARGVEFITFAMPTIVGEIKRYFRDKGWAVRVPRRLQELSLAVGKTADALAVTLGRSVTVEDIADALDASCEEIIEAQELGTAYCTMSLDAAVPGDRESKPTTLAERLGDADPAIARSEERAWLRRACETLEPKERLVISLRFYEEASQADIARRLGVSQMFISRLQKRALGKIRMALQDI